VFGRTAAWVFARAALGAVHVEAERLGVEFVAGSPKGKLEVLLYSDDGSTVLGARTADGVEHTADRAILAAGANSDLLFDFERQLRPTA
jgi:sarcosine oxidase/L-pipecolate oxidase